MSRSLKKISETGGASRPSFPVTLHPPLPVEMVFCPIGDMKTGRIRIWEVRAPALPDGGPEPLRERERMILETALGAGSRLPPDGRLLFFLHLETLGHPGFMRYLTGLLRQKGMQPQQLLLGLRESDLHSAPGFLPPGMDALIHAGMGLCLHGGGESLLNLLSLSRLRPALLLLSPALFRESAVKGEDAALLAAMLSDTCRRLGCGLGLYGVDTVEERHDFLRLGIRFMQGEAIAGEVDSPSRHGMEAVLPRPDSLPAACLCRDTGVGKLACPGLTALASDTVQSIVARLKDRPPTESVCLLHEGRPVGLLMRYHLDRHLSSPYGNALFLKKSVSRIMDAEPMIRDAGTPMEEVARAAISRSPERLYDDILITEKGAYVGTLSVRNLLDALAQAQMEMARGANPLTGLPGNTAIEKKMETYREKRDWISLIYADLDHFKVYNDAFGFEAGDRMILFTGQLIQKVAASCCANEVFVGHVGGDDFVVFTKPGEAEFFSRTLVENFGREVMGLYPEEVRRQGFVTGKDREGNPGVFPLVSISIGIVDCHFHPEMDAAELGLRVAQIKGYAKSRKGNSWVRDRREPPGFSGYFHEKGRP